MYIIKETSINATRCLTLMLAGVLSFATVAARPASGVERPSLVVGITVEGLSEDYLDLLRDHFGPGGFNLLRDSAVTITDLSYGSAGIDATAATAILYTGAAPGVNAIESATYFDPDTKVSRQALITRQKPKGKNASFTDIYSPEKIQVSTLSDELRVADGGVNHIYAVAPDPQQAVIMAGHAGNAAFWISDVNGIWSNSEFYDDWPAVIAERNLNHPLMLRLDSVKWTPSVDPASLPDLPNHRKAYPFRHQFPHNDRDRFRAFKASGPVNEEVTTVALDLMQDHCMGQKGTTDMLALAYTVAPYPYTSDSDTRMEALDSYLRIDAQIERLIKAVDNGPGRDRTVIFLTGVPAPPAGKRDEERFNIPYGQFSPRKAISLLNTFLMAQYGNAEWILGYHNQQLHLNHKLIRERDLDLTSLRSQCAAFIRQMSGVADARTLEDMLLNPVTSPEINPAHAGDLFLTITPGWEIEDEIETAGRITRPQVARMAIPSFPLFIMAPTVESETLYRSLDATAVAPTIARLLRIRSPNAASTPPLRLKPQRKQ